MLKRENQINKMLADIHAIGLSNDGLFLNAAAGFDSKGFKSLCEANGIMANIDFNKRKTKTADYERLLDD